MTGGSPMTGCIDCGALVPDIEGPTHRYIGGSPGCWQRYGELLARRYEQAVSTGAATLCVHAYAVQHPGAPDRRAAQSVQVHLMALHLMLEREQRHDEVNAAMQRLLDARRDFEWLTPPADPGELTVLHVLEARDAADHDRRARAWAHGVWGAWAEHHAVARALAASVTR